MPALAFRPMDMGKIGEIGLEAPSGILGLIVKRMEWLGTRQTLIAQNIANSDTPNFTPKDLTEKSFAQALAAHKEKQPRTLSSRKPADFFEHVLYAIGLLFLGGCCNNK